MSPLDAHERRARLRAARLYLVCGARPGGRDPEPVLRAALAGGVDVVQLREKAAGDDEVLAAAATFRRCCDQAGALLVLNDRPDLALAAGADGVHLGQDDMSPEQAHAVAGDRLIVGRSTHSPQQLDAAADADYVAVGPVHATPTKPGRAPIGLAPVEYAAAHARVPWFAIGGITPANVGEVLAAGARRVAVVRAIADAPDPGAAARALRHALDAAWRPREAGVGPA
jgi:thiamine-phosphate pyrophosphorylase